MEHRWGARTALDITVRLRLESGAVFLGRLRNASLSGAFVETGVLLPLRGEVRVELASARAWEAPPKPISGFIVRDDELGVGLEWAEFAPPAIATLLDSVASERQGRPSPAATHADPSTFAKCGVPVPALVA